MHTSILNGLGPALRWLRDRRGRKQYQVAALAGITKGMLSAYETGRQRPSLETLDKILDTLECDLNDLHNALQIINGRPAGIVRPDSRPRWSGAGSEGGHAEAAEAVDVYGVLGVAERLPDQEERALTEMLQGFHRLLRFLHSGLSAGRRAGEGGKTEPGGGSPPAGDEEG